MNIKVIKPELSFVKNFSTGKCEKASFAENQNKVFLFHHMFFGFLGASSSNAVKFRGNFFQIKQGVFKNNIYLT